MRHLKKGRKFGRVRKLRKSLIRNLAFSFLQKGSVVTTEAKAKELRPVVEKLINQAKSRNLASERQLRVFLPGRVVPKLLKDIAPKYQDRAGGYTRIIKLGRRKSDASAMAILELA